MRKLKVWGKKTYRKMQKGLEFYKLWRDWCRNFEREMAHWENRETGETK